MSTISVIIPCYRSHETIGLQLAALADQEGDLDIEVICVDNESEPSVELAQAVARSILPHTLIVGAHQGPGTAYARNVGARKAHGDKLLFCDSDDVVAADWVLRGSHLLDDVPAFSGGAVEVPESVFSLDLSEIRGYCQATGPTEVFHPGDYPVLLGCSFGMRASTFRELGGFDVALGTQGEDNDLAFRILSRYGFLTHAPEAMVAYRIRENSGITRGWRAGWNHARVITRYDAWSVSPAYQGHWAARPVVGVARSLCSHSFDPDAWGRQLGCALGRMYWKHLSHERTSVMGIYRDDIESPEGEMTTIEANSEHELDQRTTEYLETGKLPDDAE